MHARLRGPKSLLSLYQITCIIKPDLPSLADEIAEPRPDMNINVAAFTVSEKSINNTTCMPPTTTPGKAVVVILVTCTSKKYLKDPFCQMIPFFALVYLFLRMILN